MRKKRNRSFKFGNLTAEQDMPFTEQGQVRSGNVRPTDNDSYYTDGAWGLDDTTDNQINANRRDYKWNERNQLIQSSDSRYSVKYTYGHDGERTGKFATSGAGGGTSETLYFNKMWNWRYDGLLSDRTGHNSKHIFLGETRLVTKISYADGYFDSQAENVRRYYYHSDHLGNTQLITDYNGEEYERFEYTPYGELWIERTSNTAGLSIPFRFTGKERDDETQLTYFGARYYDAKISRWLSSDPALAEYVPVAPLGDNERKHNSNLPSMGGVYNLVNLHVYHYGGNNPVKYVDPDGYIIINAAKTTQQSAGDTLKLGRGTTLIKDVGCVLTSYTRIASAITGKEISLFKANKVAMDNNLFTGTNKNELTIENGVKLINALIENPNIIVFDAVSITGWTLDAMADLLTNLDNSQLEYAVTARLTTTDQNGKFTPHTLNIDSAASFSDTSGKNIRLNDTSTANRRQVRNDPSTRTNKIDRLDVFLIIRRPVQDE